MHAYLVKGGVDRAIARIAAGQYGVVTRSQLAAVGVERGAVAWRLRTGRMHPLHRGVYAVGHTAPRRETQWLAAVLACGPGAVLSHRSAASLWGIREGEGPRPDVTVPTPGGRGHHGIEVHRSVLVGDVTAHRGIPVTSPARTLADLAHTIDHDGLVRALRQAQFNRLLDAGVLEQLLTRRPSRPLARLATDLAPTQSPLEDAFLALCDGHGLPRPRTQHHIRGHRADFAWPQQRVVVETDGWEAHGTPSAFQADRAIDNALQLEGYTVLRFTHADLHRRPAHVAHQIRRALA